MTKIAARTVRIDLDEDEMPATLYLLLSRDVAERVNRVFDLHATAVPGSLGMDAVVLPVGAAADMARHFGKISGLDEARTEFYDCITGVANRFWENGVNEAPSAGLRPRDEA